MLARHRSVGSSCSGSSSYSPHGLPFPCSARCSGCPSPPMTKRRVRLAFCIPSQGANGIASIMACAVRPFSASREIPLSSGRGCKRIAQRARVLARRDCGSYDGRVCCSMYCLSTQSGARPTQAAKWLGVDSTALLFLTDQNALMLGNSRLSRRDGTPFRLLTNSAMQTFGGWLTSKWT